MNRNRVQTNGYAATQALSNNEILLRAPSVFAEEKHDSRSDRYSYLPSSEILVALRSEGFEPYFAQQSKSRIEGKSEFTKHMIRFRHLSQLGRKAVVNDTVNEIVMVNSHDGTSKLEISAGLYRYVCCNGLLVSDTQIQAVQFAHTNTSLDDVIEGSYKVLNELDSVESAIESMKSTRLELMESRALAAQALSLKFDMSEDFRPSTVDMLQRRRQEDVDPTLWNTFNTLQENLIRGGVPKTVNPPENGRAGTTRETKNITDTVKLNKGLWDIAAAMDFTKKGLI